MELSFTEISISWINLVTWISFGIVAGGAAHLMSAGKSQLSLFAACALGILGAVAGGAFATVLYGIGLHGIDLTSLSIAIAASLGFLTAYQIFSKPSNT